MKTKKIFSIILVAVILIGLMACSNNNDIVGCWKRVNVEVKIDSEDPSAQKEAKILEDLYNQYMSESSVICFNEDGTLESTENDNTLTGTYTFKDGIITSVSDEHTTTIKATVNGDNLTLEEDITEMGSLVMDVNFTETGVSKVMLISTLQKVK